jgi:cytidine deaminase
MNPKDLMKLAREAMKRSYAPYSDFEVGAAVLTSEGNVFTGCNIENASYGLSMCAERVAVYKAVSEGEEIAEIAIAAAEGDSKPCGACRQVIFELNRNAKIYFIKEGEMMTATAAQLLPESFLLQTKFKGLEPS